MKLAGMKVSDVNEPEGFRLFTYFIIFNKIIGQVEIILWVKKEVG